MATQKKKAESGGESPGGPFLSPHLPRLDLKPSAYGRDEAQGVMIALRQAPAFPMAVGLLAHALTQHADRILMDFTAAAVSIRYRVDGLWENLPPLDRPNGDGVLLVLKRVMGMNPTDRRTRQQGKTGLHCLGVDWIVSGLSQGVPSGERVLFTIEPKKPHLKSLGDLGMREKMQESLKGYLNGHGGIVAISGPEGVGLPTTWNIALEVTDKFIRDFITIEDKEQPEPEVINVTKVLFDREAGETPEAVLERRLLKQPDAFVMPHLFNDKVVGLLLKEITKEDRHLITRIDAKDAVEAVVTLLAAHRTHAKEILSKLRAVLNQRLVRRLCDRCKVPFQPTPQLLQKLGIPAGRVPKLYQPFVPPPPELRVDAKGQPIEIEICKQCQGRGYFGRMAIFELLELNDDFRAAVLKNPDATLLRTVASRLGHRSFQEEGILAAVRGTTSLQELQRLMQSLAAKA